MLETVRTTKKLPSAGFTKKSISGTTTYFINSKQDVIIAEQFTVSHTNTSIFNA